MTKVRTGRPQPAAESTAAPAATLTPTELEVCLRACAAHSGKLVGSLDRRRQQLAERLRQLLAAQVSAQPGAAPAPATGVSRFRRPARAAAPGGALGADVLDALLAVGNQALDCGYDDELRLALTISDTVLTQRKNSRAGWRLRARVCEALGNETAAIEAYDRYSGLTTDDGFGVRTRVAGLKVAARGQEELLAVLRRQCPDAAAHTAGHPTDTWSEGLALAADGDWTSARPRLVGALTALHDAGHPAQEVQRCLAQYLDLHLAHRRADGQDPAPGDHEIAALWAAQRRSRLRGPIADPTIGDVTWLTLGEFRNHIAGKSVCLIANSQRVGESSLGKEIDAYDLVVRFNSYRIDARATGARTDIHATIHKHGFNWDQHVPVRLVFGGVSPDWKHSLRTRLVPGAQDFLGDESLRWPLRNIGRVGNEAWPGIPTTGFNMLWLLDFLDVSPTLDLIGFDFYESGAYRLPEAMKQPITAVHEYISEKAWVMERAQHVTDTRISLR